MELQGSQTIASPQEVVWLHLMDSGRLAQAIPECQAIEPLGDNRFRGLLTIPIGPLHGRYQGQVAISQINPPDSYQVDFDGRGEMGTVVGNGRVQLHASGETTTIHYKGSLRVSGQLADISPRLLQANINALIRRSAEGIERALQPGRGPSSILAMRQLASRQSWAWALAVTGIFALAGIIIARTFGRKRNWEVGYEFGE